MRRDAIAVRESWLVAIEVGDRRLVLSGAERHALRRAIVDAKAAKRTMPIDSLDADAVKRRSFDLAALRSLENMIFHGEMPVDPPQLIRDGRPPDAHGHRRRGPVRSTSTTPADATPDFWTEEIERRASLPDDDHNPK